MWYVTHGVEYDPRCPFHLIHLDLGQTTAFTATWKYVTYMDEWPVNFNICFLSWVCFFVLSLWKKIPEKSWKLISSKFTLGKKGHRAVMTNSSLFQLPDCSLAPWLNMGDYLFAHKSFVSVFVFSFQYRNLFPGLGTWLLIPICKEFASQISSKVLY